MSGVQCSLPPELEIYSSVTAVLRWRDYFMRTLPRPKQANL